MSDGRAIVLRGDAAHLPLPDASVDLIVTSPPYFSLRSYTDGGRPYDGQIGAEYTPWRYLEALWACTREWIRVLKPAGSLFVVLGDKYSTYTGANWGNGRSLDGVRGTATVPQGGPVNAPDVYGIPFKSLMGLPWRYALGCTGGGPSIDPEIVKMLLRDVALGVCTLADAEQLADELATLPAPGLGLTLRAEIIWAKSNGMPENVGDRVRRSHEQIFHFTRERRYFAAVDEIREPHTMRPQRRPNGHKQRQQLNVLPAQTYSTSQRDEPGVDGHPLGKLPGTVWDVPLQPLTTPECRLVLGGVTVRWFATWADGQAHLRHLARAGWPGPRRPSLRAEGDHFAAFPMELPRRAILGWSPQEVCTACGEGRRPVTAWTGEAGRHPGGGGTYRAMRQPGERDTNLAEAPLRPRVITGYACACPDTRAATRPGVVLDPCGGTGTTALLAAAYGRTGITLDRSHGYGRLARWRTTDRDQIAAAMQVRKPPRPAPAGQATLFDLDGASA
jgi:DNA modification methylase